MIDTEAFMRVGLGMFARTLPVALLTYGVIWWIMRPKESPSFSPTDHGICFSTAWVSAVLANILFAPDVRAALTGHSSPAMILVPGLSAATMIFLFKRRKVFSPPVDRVPIARKGIEGPPVLVRVGTAKIVHGAPSNDDEWMYERVAQEIESGAVRKGLWTKLWVESGGDERETRLAYTKQRVLELASESVSRDSFSGNPDPRNDELRVNSEPKVFRTRPTQLSESPDDDP